MNRRCAGKLREICQRSGSGSGNAHDEAWRIQDHRVRLLAALKACSSSRDVQSGRKHHEDAIASGLASNISVATSLVDMYAKCREMGEARTVFNTMRYHDAVSWTALIMGYVENGESEVALDLFGQMEASGCPPNARTFVAAIMACASLAGKKQADGKLDRSRYLQKGMELHSQAAKSGFESNAYLANTLVDMYAKCGSLENARKVFDKMQLRTVISWTALILGYAENGQSGVALQLFRCMRAQGCLPNERTYVSALVACANLSALETGTKIYGEICRFGTEDDFVAACVVDFYGKCGSMVAARVAFDGAHKQDRTMWSALIAGYSRQGSTEQVFELFQKMQQGGVKADGVIFLALLTACSHAGLVSIGKKCFAAMTSKFEVSPNVLHFTCMVDLLSRSNHLEEALAMVEAMPFRADAVTWIVLLSACHKWKNVDIGRLAFESVVKLGGAEIATAYVLMANIYGSVGMWEERARVLAMKGICAGSATKTGKSSWTDCEGVVHVFGEESEVQHHPQRQALEAKLQQLQDYTTAEGIPIVNSEEDGDTVAVCGHSQRLAIACALINTQPGATIRVVKDTRLCEDCHRLTGMVARIEQRLIICRDSGRMLHVFRDGICSCGDYRASL